MTTTPRTDDELVCRECGTTVEQDGALCDECNAIYERQADERELSQRAAAAFTPCEGCDGDRTGVETFRIRIRDEREWSTIRYCPDCADLVRSGNTDVAKMVRVTVPTED